MRRKILIAAAAALSLMLIPMNAFAGSWEQEGQNWKYKQDDGSYATGAWIEDAGSWYYFNNDGIMLKDTMTPDNCRVDASGRWITEAADTANITYKDPMALYTLTPASKDNTIGYEFIRTLTAKSGITIPNAFHLYGGRNGLERKYLEEPGNGHVTYQLNDDYNLLTAKISASDSMWGDLWYRIYVTGDDGQLLYESADQKLEDVLDLAVDITGHRTVSVVVEGGRYNGIAIIGDLTVHKRAN